MQKFILAIFLFSTLGSVAELFLLDHTEGIWQWIPVSLILLSLLVLGWMLGTQSSLSVKVFQGVMVLFMLGGLTGIFLHFSGNMEFELEIYPKLSGLELVWKTLKGATPVLAPGSMIAMGLLGLVYTRF